MLKLSKNHKIYEVWNEWAAESVFVDHKPSIVEVEELTKLNEWYPSNTKYMTCKEFIKKFVLVEQLQRFYVTDTKRGGN